MLRQRVLYTTLYVRGERLLRRKKSQHGVTVHFDISGMSFRKGYSLEPVWVFITSKMISIKTVLPGSCPALSFLLLTKSPFLSLALYLTG